MSEAKPVTLGCKARDTITGFTGIVTSKTEWLNGCVRYGLQQRELRDAKPTEAQHFDEPQLEYVGPGVNVAPKPQSFIRRHMGGDRTAPTRPADPKR